MKTIIIATTILLLAIMIYLIKNIDKYDKENITNNKHNPFITKEKR